MSGNAPQTLPWLPPTPVQFPDASSAFDEPDGLLAAGGALTQEWLILAYSHGIFPWFNDDAEPILWWSPAERGVIAPRHLHVARSLRKHLKRCGWQLTFDTDFAAVVAQCAHQRAANGTWITPSMQHAYIGLHQAGYAHSLEVWDNAALVGGIYGVSLGRMFFGESMFSAATNGSKVALLALCEHLITWEFELLDCQMMNSHLASMGAQAMHRNEFMTRLHANRLAPSSVGTWQAESTCNSAAQLLAQRQQRERVEANAGP